MTFNSIIETLALGIFLMGIYYAFCVNTSKVKVKITFSQRVQMISQMEIDLDEKEIGTDYYKKIKKANFYRVVLLIFLMAVCLLKFKTGKMTLLIVVLTGILTSPRRTLLGIDSPAKRFIDYLHMKRALDFDKEIYSSAGTIKTLALLNGNGTFSADYIYEKLFEHSEKLKDIYSEFLVMYRGGNRQEAFEYFRKAINTNSGKQFATILEKLEFLNPKEMVQQIEGFQESMSQEQMTRATNEIDRNSVLTTLASTATIFAIILNFAVVGIFMDSLNMLSGLF